MHDDVNVIDDAQPAAEEACIKKFLKGVSQENYLLLWLDPSSLELQHVEGHRRSEVLVEAPDDLGDDFAIYRLTGGVWVYDSGRDRVDHEALLAQFMVDAHEASARSQHPARRAVRSVQAA